MGKLLKSPSILLPLAELALNNGRVPSKNEWKTWVLEREAIWEDGEGNRIVVPVGFMTDFASIPRAFRWWQTGSVGPQRVAAYFHDWLYSSQNEFNRKTADREFRKVMQFAGGKGVRKFVRRWLMWAALRVGGWMAWRSNQKKFRELGPDWRILA